MAWDQLYRPLEKDEIILETDDVYDDSSKTWIRTPNCVGKPAPDRLYTSHRQYRRLRTYDELIAYLKEVHILMAAGPTKYSGEDYMVWLRDTEDKVSRAIGEYDYDDILDTPEQRKLIADHNAAIKEKYPNLVELTA